MNAEGGCSSTNHRLERCIAGMSTCGLHSTASNTHATAVKPPRLTTRATMSVHGCSKKIGQCRTKQNDAIMLHKQLLTSVPQSVGELSATFSACAKN